MHSNSTHPAEGLQQGFNPEFLESATEVQGDRLGNDRVPAFSVQLNAGIELREIKVALRKVLLEFLGDVVVAAVLLRAEVQNLR